MALYNVFKRYYDGDSNECEWYKFTISCELSEIVNYCIAKNRKLKEKYPYGLEEYFFFEKADILTIKDLKEDE